MGANNSENSNGIFKSWWSVLSLGFIVGGGLATAVLTTACPNGSDGFGEGEVAERISPPAPEPGDDLKSPTGGTCTNGWRPMGLIEGLGGYTDMSVDENGVLALATPNAVELWDVRAARSPVNLGRVNALDLGTHGGFGEVAATSRGFAAIAARGEGERQHLVAAIVPRSGPIDRPEDMKARGGDIGDIADKPESGFPTAWVLGDHIQIGERASHIDALGEDFVVAGTQGVIFGKHEARGLGIVARNTYGHGDTLIHPNAVALDTANNRAIVTSSRIGISLLPMRHSGSIQEVETLGNPQTPLLLRNGWLIPESNHPTMYMPPLGPTDVTTPGTPTPDGPSDITDRPQPTVDGPSGVTTAPQPSVTGPKDLTNPPKPSPDGPKDITGSAAEPNSPEGPTDLTGAKPLPPGDARDGRGDLPEGQYPHVEGAFLEYMDGETGRMKKVAEMPAISAFDAEDGPFQVINRGDTLYVANSESGLLRLTWNADGMKVDTRQALTTDEWADMPSRPQKLVIHNDTLFIMEPYGDAVGVVQLCE